MEFEFQKPSLKETTYSGLNSLRQKKCYLLKEFPGFDKLTYVPILAPFCGINQEKSKFSLTSGIISFEARIWNFLKKWLVKLKCPDFLKPIGTLIQENYWPFYPSEPFRIPRFNMRHPVRRYPYTYFVFVLILVKKGLKIAKNLLQGVSYWNVGF